LVLGWIPGKAIRWVRAVSLRVSVREKLKPVGATAPLAVNIVCEETDELVLEQGERDGSPLQVQYAPSGHHYHYWSEQWGILRVGWWGILRAGPLV
jgi:hypothetical protein